MQRLKQVLVILIMSAIKASDINGEIAISLELSQQGETAILVGHIIYQGGELLKKETDYDLVLK